jgi:homoserine O-acetyltransferase/O-succinyltransferase
MGFASARIQSWNVVGDMHCENHGLGTVTLQYGGELPAAQIGYRTFGEPNERKDNVILFPTWCSGTTRDVDWIIGSGRVLDPAKYFIVAVDIFGNGNSSSPSNTPPPYDRTRFPLVSLLDNVVFQRRLLAEKFAIDRLKLIVGRSMGAQIAFQWGSYFPDQVERILPFCGSARTAHHNVIFLENLKLVLTSPQAWNGGEYETNPAESMRRMRLMMDAWGLSQDYYRQELHLKNHATTKAYIERDDVPFFGDVNDLLAQIATWEAADISDNDRFKGDFTAALRAIKAKAIVMPGRTDLYFPPEDSEIEVRSMPNAELRVIPSVWGHRSGAPGGDPADIAFLERAIDDLLSDRVGVEA